MSHSHFQRETKVILNILSPITIKLSVSNKALPRILLKNIMSSLAFKLHLKCRFLDTIKQQMNFHNKLLIYLFVDVKINNFLKKTKTKM